MVLQDNWSCLGTFISVSFAGSIHRISVCLRHILIVGVQGTIISLHRSKVIADRIDVLILAKVCLWIVEWSLRVVMVVLGTKVHTSIGIIVSCGTITRVLLNIVDWRAMDWVCIWLSRRFLLLWIILYTIAAPVPIWGMCWVGGLATNEPMALLSLIRWHMMSISCWPFRKIILFFKLLSICKILTWLSWHQWLLFMIISKVGALVPLIVQEVIADLFKSPLVVLWLLLSPRHVLLFKLVFQKFNCFLFYIWTFLFRLQNDLFILFIKIRFELLIKLLFLIILCLLKYSRLLITIFYLLIKNLL